MAPIHRSRLVCGYVLCQCSCAISHGAETSANERRQRAEATGRGNGQRQWAEVSTDLGDGLRDDPLARAGFLQSDRVLKASPNCKRPSPLACAVPPVLLSAILRFCASACAVSTRRFSCPPPRLSSRFPRHSCAARCACRGQGGGIPAAAGGRCGCVCLPSRRRPCSSSPSRPRGQPALPRCGRSHTPVHRP